MTGLAFTMWEERGEQRDEVLLRARATAADGRPHVLTIVNLSSGGLMARSVETLAPGDPLWVELPLLGRVKVEVRWALGGRIGCRFEQPVPPDRYDPLLAAARAR